MISNLCKVHNSVKQTVNVDAKIVGYSALKMKERRQPSQTCRWVSSLCCNAFCCLWVVVLTMEGLGEAECVNACMHCGKRLVPK